MLEEPDAMHNFQIKLGNHHNQTAMCLCMIFHHQGMGVCANLTQMKTKRTDHPLQLS